MSAISLTQKRRLLFLLIIFTILAIVLVIRLGWIQLVKGEWYQKQAYIQQTQDRVISPKRGTIFDRNMKELAISASVETISINPQTIKKSEEDIEFVASGLSSFLGIEKDKITKKLKMSSRYEVIARKIERPLGNKVREWVSENKINGIYIDEDTKRYYPNRNLAAQVIGFTSIDNSGIDGIEKIMESYLKGVPGKILSEVDASGLEIPFKEEKLIPAQDGYNVVLTIDESIQYFAEKAINKAINDNKLINGATAIVMDPNKGEILAMVSKPDYDLNNPRAKPSILNPKFLSQSEYPKTLLPYWYNKLQSKEWSGSSSQDIEILQKTVWRNKAVMDTYEPGSTFKAITSAAALEEGVATPDSPANDFPVTVKGWTIHCWKTPVHGNETFKEGVYNSCNPVFVRVAQAMGIEKFYSYIKAFGFNEKTGIDLPGEVQSIIHKKPTEIDMATAAFGQSFQITPIQLITAYAAIANGGKLMKPHVVKAIVDNEGNVVQSNDTPTIRNVISKETDDTLKGILEGVVSQGTGGHAYIKGFRVAGKTGTSETMELRKGAAKRYIASFSAFAPADNPIACVLVILDYPNTYPHTGGVIAAPVAGKIVEDVMSYMGVTKVYSEEDKQKMSQEVIVSDLRGKKASIAIKELKQRGLDYKIEGDKTNLDAIIMDQTPKPNASLAEKSIVVLYTYKPQKEIYVKVPQMKYMGIYNATKALNDIGLNIRASGSGTAMKQSIDPGSEVPVGKVIEVDFKNVDPNAE
jgi:stage V sporulation protein D (sporulation-specific penicillin-binding protein)